MAFDSKSQWKKSVENCGMCLYFNSIPATSIYKVSLYTYIGRETNNIINRKLSRQKPFEYNRDKEEDRLINKWFTAEPFDDEECQIGKHDYFNNRSGLDLFYLSSEPAKKYWDMNAA